MINERKNDIEDKHKNEDKNPTNTINNQNRNEETKKDLNEIETDLKKKIIFIKVIIFLIRLKKKKIFIKRNILIHNFLKLIIVK